jgi:hypothetical protein
MTHPGPKRLSFAAVALAATLASAPPALAQFTPPPPDQPDLTIDAATRKAVIDSLTANIERRYVFPDLGKTVAKELRDRLRKGRYDSITSAIAFADTLRGNLRELAHDRHLRVHYSYRALAPEDSSGAPTSPEEHERFLADARRRNWGFEHVERLLGNVGYIELRNFEGTAEAGTVAQAAMQFLANADALIFDLRRNGGGDPNMIVLLLSHLYGDEDRVHVNDFYQRGDTLLTQYWTTTTVPGPRFAGKPVYVLTSKLTGSAAEEFSYDIKSLKRGTLVGETTAGGANPGGLVRLDDHFVAFIADGRAINPVTKTNWEGVGVEPDVKVPADDALTTAHIAALNTLIAGTTDADHRAMLGRALEIVKNPAKK